MLVDLEVVEAVEIPILRWEDFTEFLYARADREMVPWEVCKLSP